MKFLVRMQWAVSADICGCHNWRLRVLTSNRSRPGLLCKGQQDTQHPFMFVWLEHLGISHHQRSSLMSHRITMPRICTLHSFHSGMGLRREVKHGNSSKQQNDSSLHSEMRTPWKGFPQWHTWEGSGALHWGIRWAGLCWSPLGSYRKAPRDNRLRADSTSPHVDEACTLLPEAWAPSSLEAAGEHLEK